MHRGPKRGECLSLAPIGMGARGASALADEPPRGAPSVKVDIRWGFYPRGAGIDPLGEACSKYTRSSASAPAQRGVAIEVPDIATTAAAMPQLFR